MKKPSILLSVFLGSASMLISCGGTTNSEDSMPVEEGAAHVMIYTRNFEEYVNQAFNRRIKQINSDLTDGIQVDVTYIPESQWDPKISADRSSNNGPDIFIAAYNHIYQQITLENVVPLDDYVSKGALDDIDDKTLDAVKFNDKYYAYPYYVEPSTMLFYSKSKLENAGVTLPGDETTWTWEDLLFACAKLKPTLGIGEYALQMPVQGDTLWATWGECYNQIDGWILSDNWDKSRIKEKRSEFIELLEFYTTLHDNEYIPTSGLTSGGYNTAIEAICNGDVAMTLGGGYSLGTVNSDPIWKEMKDDIGVIPLPTKDGDANKVTATNGGWTWMIDAQSKNKELAGKVIEKLCFDCSMEEFVDIFEISDYCRFSPRKSVAAYLEDKVGSNNHFYQVTKKVYQNSVFEPLYPISMSKAVGAVFENALFYGSKSYENVTDDLHVSIEKLIVTEKTAGTNPHYKG